MTSFSNSIRPLDLVLISGIASEPVICIVSPNSKEIILSTKTQLSNALVDARIVHSNLGSLIQLVGSDIGVYSEIVQAICDRLNIPPFQASKDCLFLARAFNYIKLNYDIGSFESSSSLKEVIAESLDYADEIQLSIEKAHYAIIKLNTFSSQSVTTAI